MYQRRVTRMPRSVGADHFVHGFIAAGENEIHGRFAVFIGEREAVAGGLGFHFFRGGARIDEIFRHAAIHEQHFLPWDAFAVVGRAGLQRMIDVVPDGNIFAEDFLAHAAGEAGALVEHGRAREIVEEEADKIEDGRRFEDRGVAAGRKLTRLARGGGFAAGAFGEGVGIESQRMSGEFDLAQPEEFSSRMVTENSARVCSYARNEPPGIRQHGLRRAGGKDSRGGLLGFLRHFADARDGAGAVLAEWPQRSPERSARLSDISAARASEADPGFSGLLRARLTAAATARRRDSSSVLLVVARAVRPSTTARTEMRERAARRRSDGWCCWRSG